MKLRTFTEEVLDDRLAEALRSKTSAERLMLTVQLWEFAAQLVRDMIRAQHPDWSAEQVQQAVARRMSHGAV